MNPSSQMTELGRRKAQLSDGRESNGSASFQNAIDERRLLHRWFEEQARSHATRVAAVLDGQELTYDALNRQANRVAHLLLEAGAGPELLVGLCVERSLDLLVGMLGILKAGAAYLPLDPCYPKERLDFMLADAEVKITLTQEHLLPGLPQTAARIICLDRDRQQISWQSSENPVAFVLPDNAAYVIYTSGSTGRPKGVVVTHANVVRLFEETCQWFNFSSEDVWTLFHSSSFDFSVWETWGALLHGGKLVIVPYFVSRTPEAFYSLLFRERVTVLNQTPSAFRQLIRVEDDPAQRAELALRLVIFGGEALELEGLRPWIARHGDESPQLVNMFGITETTVHVTYRRVLRSDLDAKRGSVIGEMIPDLRTYICEERLHPLAAGDAGELYVAGAGLARGYLRRPDLTAERFIPDPFSQQPGGRLYRTGDLARSLVRDDLEYLGRIDQQVKVRGFRIELGEIESQLLQYPGVKECAVTAHQDNDGEKRLVAYIVPGRPAPALETLQNYLQKRLPDYMLPAAILFLTQLPLTAHGKLDRSSLPKPERHADPSHDIEDRACNTTERLLAEVWCDSLGLSSVDIDDNYFLLGGDSIRSIKVRAKGLEKGLEFSLQQLFSNPTIRSLAAEISRSEPVSAEEVRPSSFDMISDEDRRRLPEDAADAYPISPLQSGMIFHSEYSSDYIVYVSSFYLRLKFEANKMQQALDRLAARHEMLRTSFAPRNFTAPLQIVHRTVHLPLAIEDLRHLPPQDQELKIDEWLESEARRRFDWEKVPLFRFHVHLRSDDAVQFTLSEPFLDGWSVASLLTELFEHYFVLLRDEAMEFPPLGALYKDFVALEQEALQSTECRDYWARILSGSTATRLPLRKQTSVSAGPEVVRLQVPIAAETATGLKNAAGLAGVSIKSLLLAAHMKVLSVLSGQSEVFTGLLINGRPEKRDGEKLVGAFLNTIPFCMRLGSETWVALAREAQAAETEALPHRRFPIQELQRLFRAEEKFDTIFNYTHFYVLDRLQTLPDLAVLGMKGSEQTYFPLTAQFSMNELSSQMELALDYRTKDFEEAQVSEIAGYYERVLRAIAADPVLRHDTLCLLSNEQIRLLLTELNTTQASFPDSICLHELFTRQAEKFPANFAVVCGEERLTYAELEHRANQLARYLQDAHVGPETLVGICAERSVKMIVGLLGILKAGGAYLPLDPEYPDERLAFMLRDAEVKVVVTEERLLKRIPAHEGRRVCLDSEWPQIETASRMPLPSRVQPGNLAYVIYTSGSTGQPKGVLIEHRGVVNTIAASIKRFGVNEKSRVVQLASLNFDASVLEIFTALLSGATLYLVDRELLMSGQELGKSMEQNAITAAFILPSLLDSLPGNAYPCLQSVVIGGEACSAETAARWSVGRRLFNAYAPTEATIYATVAFCAEGERQAPPLGSPIQNMQVYLLDQYAQPALPGVPGELHIAGVGVARGYLGRPELTAERFVPNPFGSETGTRLYKTGDLARFLANGAIQFLGRTDQQVKIRGFRIELGEIEAALGTHPKVRERAVVVREDSPGEKRIVAYLVPQSGEEPTISDLRNHLKTRVPDYMLPAIFVMLDSLPLSETGKLDRSALPVPERLRPELTQRYLAPRTSLEKVLARIFSEVLKIEEVGILDDFFELGGHSLIATQVVSRIRQLFSIELPLTTLFEEPCISGLTTSILAEAKEPKKMEETAEILLRVLELPEEQANVMFQEIQRFKTERLSTIGGCDLSEARQAVLQFLLQKARLAPFDTNGITRRQHSGPVPLSFGQQRLWFLQQLDPSSLYNIPAAVRIQGLLDVAALEHAINEIIRRHESLRTVFKLIDGQPFQFINPSLRLELSPVTVSSDAATAKKEITEHAAAEARHVFDLSRGPVVRARLLRISDSEHVLLLCMHHIVSDGWSMALFLHELEAYYGGRLLPEPTIQYLDYAFWQRDEKHRAVLDDQLAYWKQQLAGIPPVLALATDYPRSAARSFRGSAVAFAVSPDLSARLLQAGNAEGATLFMTMLAAFGVLLYRYCGQEDFAIGTPVAGRGRPEIEKLIGFFVNTLPLRLQLTGGLTFRQLLRNTKDTCLNAYVHQDVPFEALVEELHPERNLGHSPLFQVMLDLQNAPLAPVSRNGLRFNLLPVETGTAKFDLTLTLNETEHGLDGALEYSSDLFEQSTAVRIVENFCTLLDSIAADPDSHLGALAVLSETEKKTLLIDWQMPRAESADRGFVHHLFEGQAERNPDQTAVVCSDESLSYRELNRRANQIAHYLRDFGLGPEALAGICMQRSCSMVIAVLAVLKTGAAYIPLDPAYPRERLVAMIKDSEPHLVITERRFLQNVSSQDGRTIALDSEFELIATKPCTNLITQRWPENPAYVIYTSGSTGRPKGVVISHANLAHSTQARLNYYKELVHAFLLLPSFSFDSSVAGLFWTLCHGGKLVIPEEGSQHDPEQVAELIRRQSISHLLCLPSFYRLLLGERGEKLASLRVAIVAGEAAAGDLVHLHRGRLPQAQLFNEYGPTEATVWSTVFDFAAGYTGNSVPIGRTVSNTRTYVLDQNLQLVPIGAVGELYIGGDGVARGYRNCADLTAERFIPDSFSEFPGSRLYRTGDLARYRADGEIEFLGRNDLQVKVRGHRIEPAEIEVALSQHPAVQQAAVAVSQGKLTAYVVMREPQSAGAIDLRSHLSSRLPNYMLPEAFILMETLPYTTTGKVDRRALNPADGSHVASALAYVAPRTALEQVLAEIFAAVLGRDRVGIHDNFFETGGHSLAATQLLSRIRDALQIELPLRRIFEQPAVEGLAGAILADPQEGRRVERTAELLIHLSSLSDQEAAAFISNNKHTEQIS